MSEQEIITNIKYKFKSKKSFQKSDNGCISGMPDCIKIVLISNSLLQCKRIKIIILSKLIHFYCFIFFFYVLFSLNEFFEKITLFFQKIYLYLKLRAESINNNILFLSVFPPNFVVHI